MKGNSGAFDGRIRIKGSLKSRIRQCRLILLLISFIIIAPLPVALAQNPTGNQGSSVISRLKSADTLEHPSQKLIPGIRKTLNQYPPYYIYLFISGFALLAVIRLVAPDYLRELVQSIVNLKVLLNLFQDSRFGFNLFNLLLDVLSIGMFSILIQQFFFPANFDVFVWIVAYVAVAYILKLILIQLIANIFLGRGEALVHLLLHLLFTRLCGILLLPIGFFILYQVLWTKSMLLEYVVIFLLFFYTGWLLRLYVKMKSISVSGAVYLFLYLCTIELSPLAVVLRNYILQ